MQLTGDGRPGVAAIVGFVEMVWAGLVVAAGFALLLAFYWWLGKRIRRAGIGGGLMGPLDEAWNPGRHKFREVVEVQEQRMEPVESPGDRLNP